ncbi:hypothetical protein BC830DRAFT_1164930 [Chytriomyces sp. MP71]|nr:hypothetical protein BC830DRAFT_1164930 [Chytriomyces sp. MP71]
MGKHSNRPPRKQYRAAARANPIYSTTSAEHVGEVTVGEEAETGEMVATSNLNALLKDQIVPIVKKLQSENADDRSWAAAAVSSLVVEEDSRVQLLKGGVIPVLVHLISASDVDSTLVDLVGACANLATFGGNDVCDEMERRGIVDASQNVVQKCLNSIHKCISGSMSDADNAFLAAFEQCVSLLVSLVDFSDKAFASTTRLMGGILVDALVSLLASTEKKFKAPHSLLTLSAQLLNNLSEENKELFPYFPKHHLNSLSNIASGAIVATPLAQDPQRAAYIRILSSSILANTQPLPINHLVMVIVDTFQTINIPSLTSQISEICVKGVFANTSSSYRQRGTGNAAKGKAIAQAAQEQSEQLTTGAERILDTANSAFAALQLSLEVLVNAYSEDYEEGALGDDEWGDNGDDAMEDGGNQEMEADEGEEDGDDTGAYDEMMQDADLAATMASESGTSSSQDPSNPSSESATRVSLVSSYNLLERLLHLSHEAASATSTLAPHIKSPAHPFYPLETFLNAVKQRAFNALTNILSTLSGTPFYSPSNATTVHKTWVTIFDAAHTAAGSPGPETLAIVESAVGALWALARGVDAHKPRGTLTLDPTDAHIHTLISTANLPGAPAPLRIKCIHTLSLLARDPASPLRVNAAIGPFLLRTATDEAGDVETAAEALLELYDVYADAGYHYDAEVYVHGGFTQALREAAAGFKKRVKGLDKRRNRGARERADEALLNLGPFVRYKEDEARKVSSLFL